MFKKIKDIIRATDQIRIIEYEGYEYILRIYRIEDDDINKEYSINVCIRPQKNSDNKYFDLDYNIKDDSFMITSLTPICEYDTEIKKMINNLSNMENIIPEIREIIKQELNI